MGRLIINIPNNFIPERRYAIEVLFEEILGLNVLITEHQENFYTIILPNKKEIIIRDCFFSGIKESDFPRLDLIPQNVVFFSNRFLFEKDIPVLFGSDELDVEENKIVCGIDVFASSFFMLSRWEETVIMEKDEFERFRVEDSISFKFNFLHRPIVNEYAELCRNMLVHLGYAGVTEKSTFKIVPTHDVDVINYPADILQLGGDLLNSKSLAAPLKRLVLKIQGKNPNLSFDRLMDIGEKNDVKSRFYFMSVGKHSFDNRYDPASKNVKNIVRNIKDRGHIIGFHPGYDTYLDKNEWKRQHLHLENDFKLKLNEGRQHFLRFSFPETLDIWEENNMRVDSTLGYPSVPGFRCGTANIFTMFNTRTKKKLLLKEMPLIWMDTSIHSNKDQKVSLIKAHESLNYFKDICRRYNMLFTVNFHNNNFEPVRWEGWFELYESLFQD